MKAWEYHEYTCTSIQNPDLRAYGLAGWELVAVLPCENGLRYTFWFKREYLSKQEKTS